MEELRYRQIHLDFHTSPLIPGIGEDFDPDEFAQTLQKAHVNSVTCFARCHHGYIYFDTKKHPERHHPYLKRNLLAEQIEACHKRDIRVPVYITVQWDHYTADQHPEWLALDSQGRIQGTGPFEAGFYRSLCVNSPYLDFLKEHTQEVLETFPVDGLFFDIVIPLEDSSKWSRDAMVKLGMDPQCAKARKAYGKIALDEFKQDMTSFVRQFNKDCTIFYNAGHIGTGTRDSSPNYSHFELETLPSGGWGYMHFPVSMRYARNLGKDCLGMTGKFHTSWGDFHSFKPQAALRYECLQMLALNAKCSIGDQLHPTGKICPHTYDLIGSVYAEVEQKESWCTKAKPVVDIGILTTEEFCDDERVPPSVSGALRMLMEGAYQADVLDSRSDFSPYRLLVLPDGIIVNADLEKKLTTYLTGGGKIIASYRSGMNPQKDAFALPQLGIKYIGDAAYQPDFIIPQGAVGKGLPETEHVMYLRGVEVKPESAKVLASVVGSYFNRNYQHFCSHRHTPSSGEVVYPGIVQNGNVIYFAHPIFQQYYQNTPLWVKTMFLNSVEMLLPDPVVRVKAPSTLLVTLNEQESESRQILHMLHFIPERRGQDFDILFDVIPLYHIPVSIRMPHLVRRVSLAPQGGELPFEQNDARISFTVPEVNGHQMVVIEY